MAEEHKLRCEIMDVNFLAGLITGAILEIIVMVAAAVYYNKRNKRK